MDSIVYDIYLVELNEIEIDDEVSKFNEREPTPPSNVANRPAQSEKTAEGKNQRFVHLKLCQVPTKAT